METTLEARKLDQLVDQLDTLSSGIKSLIDRISGKPELSQAKVLSRRVTSTIQADPIASAAIALGVGYLVVRILRQ